MWLNPLKGAHLTLGQLDKTLPVDVSAVATVGGESVRVNAKIQRGSIVFISTGKSQTGTPRFQLYTATEAKLPNAVPYVALMGVTDFQAGMAGNVGQAPEVDPSAGVDKGTLATGNKATWLQSTPASQEGIVGVTDGNGIRGPRITAISLVQPAEWETSAFDKTVSTYYVGMPLSVNNEGKLTPWTQGDNIVGYVTAVPYSRWVNDLGASADGARISGGTTKVIAFSTAWIPAAAVASGNDKNVDMLSLKGAARPAAQAQAPAAPAPAASAQAPAASAQAPAAPAQKAPVDSKAK